MHENVGRAEDQPRDRSRGRGDWPAEERVILSDGPLADVVARCAAALQAGGILAALRFLNARTRFRYTGIYGADPPVLRNLHLFDRENPELNLSGDVAPLSETYCGITYGTNAPFATADALGDPRLHTHAARESVLSYCGVPLREDSGRPRGSLCHFDVRPRLAPATEQRTLETVAPLLLRWLAETGM
jgi:hypothetical protein